MELKFTAENHKYETPDKPDFKWLSVTSAISLFKPPFDKDAIAKKSSKNKKSKWYGMSPEEIIKAWDNENKRALKLGSWYHDQREQELIACDTLQRNGIDLNVIRPIEQDGIKLAPDQSLVSGIYPEHMVYLKSAGICGQSDLVEVVNGKVSIIDYKTNKEIKMQSYVDWEGISQKMQFPVSHLDDCNFNHYALQLSIYMYIILKHNPKLRVGSMFIHHVQFEEEGKDEHGYPITKYTEQGDPLLKDLVQIPVPYLKDEVISLIHYLHDNRKKLKKK